jgi:hypothetical protein
MQLLGDWNWWLPPFLRWLPHIAIEGGPEMTEPEETAVLPPEVLGSDDGDRGEDGVHEDVEREDVESDARGRVDGPA